MLDQIYDRGYQAGRVQLHEGLDSLIRAARDAVTPALTALHHLEWDAPWHATPRPKH